MLPLQSMCWCSVNSAACALRLWQVVVGQSYNTFYAVLDRKRTMTTYEEWNKQALVVLKKNSMCIITQPQSLWNVWFIYHADMGIRTQSFSFDHLVTFKCLLPCLLSCLHRCYIQVKNNAQHSSLLDYNTIASYHANVFPLSLLVNLVTKKMSLNELHNMSTENNFQF